MPITQSAKKALRRDRSRTAANLPVRTLVGTLVHLAMEERTPESISAAFSAIDRASKRHVIHRNKAARLKSRLMVAVRRAG